MNTPPKKVCHDDTKGYLKGKGVICWCPHICPNAWLCPRFEKIDKMSLILLVAQLFTATYSCLFWFVKLIYQGFQSVRINHWFPGPCRSGCHGQTQRHLRAFGPDMSSSSSRILQCKEMTIQPESDRLNYSWRSEIWKSDSFLACESDIACHSEKNGSLMTKGVQTGPILATITIIMAEMIIVVPIFGGGGDTNLLGSHILYLQQRIPGGKKEADQVAAWYGIFPVVPVQRSTTTSTACAFPEFCQVSTWTWFISGQRKKASPRIQQDSVSIRSYRVSHPSQWPKKNHPGLTSTFTCAQIMTMEPLKMQSDTVVDSTAASSLNKKYWICKGTTSPFGLNMVGTTRLSISPFCTSPFGVHCVHCVHRGMPGSNIPSPRGSPEWMAAGWIHPPCLTCQGWIHPVDLAGFFLGTNNSPLFLWELTPPSN